MPVNIAPLLFACAPLVHPVTAQALLAVESEFNPYAIGVVGGVLERQPTTLRQAIATARALRVGGWDFSVGLAQINVRNWERMGLSAETVFDPCVNLRAMQRILQQCYARATIQAPQQARLRAALSCYYAGDFAADWRDGYVQRVVAATRTQAAGSASLRSGRPN